MSNQGTGGGWTIGRSIALELDMALLLLSGAYPLVRLPDEVARVVRSMPAEWNDELREMFGASRAVPLDLEAVAVLAGVLVDDDYGRVTLAMRELTFAEAVQRIKADLERLGEDVDGLTPRGDELGELWLRLKLANYWRLGFASDALDRYASEVRRDVGGSRRILRDGDLHSRFWHWLDRFYYEFYRPWRQEQAETLERLEKRAVTVLGAQEMRGVPPMTDWLPPQNPLLRYPGIRSAVQAGELPVFFWVEPFGIPDTWSLLPEVFVTSFAEPGLFYRAFETYARDVANRTSALADPTRLIILRLIRRFGMINSEIADYLDLARPTVSVHAKILREAGLIRSTKEGREVRHQIVSEEVRRLFRDLEHFLDLPEGEG